MITISTKAILLSNGELETHGSVIAQPLYRHAQPAAVVTFYRDGIFCLFVSE